MTATRMNASHHLDRYRLGLLIIVWLAWALRLYHLDAQSLWYDEGVTATLAQRSLADLTQWTARDIQPPLYYYLVWGWGRVGGWSEWSLRFVSAWWGLLAIPLLTVVAQRLTKQRGVAWVAALLATLHPLFVYYSQEARMYTMLVALGILAGYLLLCIRESERFTWKIWISYGLAATAAVYTHYFAFFLLLALGVAFLIDHFATIKSTNDIGLTHLGTLWVPRLLRNRHLRGFVITNGTILLLYLAWIGALFQQLQLDRSYWQGELNLREALRSIALDFTRGETGLEQNTRPLLLLYLGITLLAVVVIGWQARRTPAWRRTLLYGLCWLAIPIAGVLGLAAFVPKFNPRYVLIALPGLLLLWSSGIASLAQKGPWVARLGGAAILLLLLAGFGNANRNWFTDPSFTKAQWREVAAYVRERRHPDEAIILVSGHAWPIWAYYAPDLPAIRLPALEILDVNAVLDFANTGEVLRTALRGKKGAWLVNWQDEVVDPNGIAPRQLQLAAQEERVKDEFWQLHIRHFVDLNPATIETTPPIDTMLQANFGDQINLQGYGVAADGDLLLFWQLGTEPPTPLPDLRINLRTTTGSEGGGGWLYADPADRRPADYHFPVMRWQPGQLVMGRIPTAEWAGAGALPGLYQVQLGVYDPADAADGLDLLDPAGNRLGKFVMLNVKLTQTTPSEPPPSAVDDTEILAGIRLAFPFDQVAAEPGQAVPVAFDWFLEKKLSAVPELRLQWRLSKDAPIAASSPLSMTGAAPMTTWPMEHWVRQVIAIQPPSTLPPGDYLLELLATGRDNPARRPFTVLPSQRNFTVPPLAVTLEADFGVGQNGTPGITPQVRLLGLSTAFAPTITPNQPITVNLAWQSIAPTVPAADYVATLQLLGDDGVPVAQVDQGLPGGSAGWLMGQVEEQSLALVAPIEAGRYRLIVALYHATQGGYPRLITNNGADFVELGVVTVTP